MKIENVHKCPYCGYTYQAVFGQNVFAHLMSDPGANVAQHAVIFQCPYAGCRKIEMFVDAGTFPPALKAKTEAERNKLRDDLPNTFFRQRLLPLYVGGKDEFKTESVPDAVYKDYDEACKLLQVSPPASATYARRCVQNMIRQKFKIKPGKLQNEIGILANLSTPVRQEVIDALESVRKMGKFRALPEDDVKVIVDITAKEARKIIDIIEILLYDWFIAPEEHNRRLFELKSIADNAVRKTGE